jgi:hypothetical protein
MRPRRRSSVPASRAVGVRWIKNAISVLSRHPAYAPSLPIVYDLDGAAINWAEVQVYDVDNDPYNFDVLYGPGNGWTCDGIG